MAVVINRHLKQIENDENIFLTSLVPLRLESSDNVIIWQNPQPSSTRFCSPIRLTFVHETKEVSIRKKKITFKNRLILW